MNDQLVAALFVISLLTPVASVLIGFLGLAWPSSRKSGRRSDASARA